MVPQNEDWIMVHTNVGPRLTSFGEVEDAFSRCKSFQLSFGTSPDANDRGTIIVRNDDDMEIVAGIFESFEELTPQIYVLLRPL